MELAAWFPGGNGQGAQHSKVLSEAWGLRRGCPGTGCHECQVKESNLYFVDGSVPSTECESRSILSGLKLESSAWWQLWMGWKGTSLEVENISEATRSRFSWLRGLEMESLVVSGIKDNS